MTVVFVVNYSFYPVLVESDLDMKTQICIEFSDNAMSYLEAIIHVKLFEAEFVVEIGADGDVQISDLSGRVDTESEDELAGSRLFCDGHS